MPKTKAVILRPVATGKIKEAEYRIGSAGATLGRHASNDVILPYDSISRFHAKIVTVGNRYILQDMGSSNGTYIDGKKIEQMPLSDRSKVNLGNVAFTCELETEGEDTIFPHKQESSGIVEFQPGQSDTVLFETSIKPSEVDVISRSGESENLEELKQSHRQLRILYRLAELLQSNLETAELLNQCLTLTFDAVPAQRGVIMLRDAYTSDLKPFAFNGHDEGSDDLQLMISRSIVDKCLNDQVALLVRDTATDERFDASQSIFRMNIRSAISAPLIAGGNVLGIIFIDTKDARNSFVDRDLEFVSGIANEMAMSLDLRSKRDELVRNSEFTAMGETVLSLAHGIKNILLVSESGSQLLDKALNDGNMDSAKQCWGAVYRSVDRISSLVRDMLDFGREWKPQWETRMLNPVVQNIVESCRADCENRKIELSLNLSEEVGTVRLDIEAFKQSLENLIVNAAEAINEGKGKIEIETTLIKGHCNVCVSDNGEGISPENLSKVFFPRFSTKGEKGTGIGLASVKKYFTAMGGAIHAESTVGVGSRFILSLPADVTSAQS